jgi:hypothetical protein
MINNSYFNKFIESDIIYNTNLSSTTSNYVDSLYNSDDSPFLTFNSINNVWTGYTETSSKFYSNQLISKDDYSYLLNCDISFGNYKFYIIDEYGTKISNEVSVGVGTSQNNLTINSSNSNYSYLIGETNSSIDSKDTVFTVYYKSGFDYYDPLSGTNLTPPNGNSLKFPYFIKLIKMAGYNNRLALILYYESPTSSINSAFAIYGSTDGGQSWFFIGKDGNFLTGLGSGTQVFKSFVDDNRAYIHHFNTSYRSYLNIDDLFYGPITEINKVINFPNSDNDIFPYLLKNQVLYSIDYVSYTSVSNYVYNGFGVEYFLNNSPLHKSATTYTEVVGDLYKISPTYISSGIDEMILVGMSLTGRSMIVRYSAGTYNTLIDSAITNERYDKISYINKNLSYVIKMNKVYSYNYNNNTINFISTINLLPNSALTNIGLNRRYEISSDMKFFNSAVGYILYGDVFDKNLLSLSNYRKLIKTSDGGLNWTELLLLNSAITQVQIYNENTILYSESIKKSYSSAFNYYRSIIDNLYYTKDGGNTWKSINISNLSAETFQVEYLDYKSNLTDYLILLKNDSSIYSDKNIYYLELDNLDSSDFVGNLELLRIHYDYDLNINTKYNENDKYFDYDGINFYYSGINYQFETDNKYVKYKLQPFLYDVWTGFTNDFILYDDFILTGYTYDIDNLTETIKIFPTNVEDLNHFKKYTFVNFTITNSNDYSLILDITDEYLLINIPKNNTNDIITFNSAFTYNISNNNIQNVYKLGEISNVLYDIYTNWNDDLEFNDHYYYQIRCDRTKKKIYNSYGEILNSDFLIRKYCTGLIYCDENGKPIYKIYNENDNNLTYDLTELVFIGKDKKSRFPIRLKNDNIINE